MSSIAEGQAPHVGQAPNVGQAPPLKNVGTRANDAGLEMVLPVRADGLVVWCLLAVAAATAPLLWWLDYVGVASILMVVATLEALFTLRRAQRGPVALAGQGMRWWWVNRDGELTGPFWLDEHTRLGGTWMTLCLRDAQRNRQRILLGRWRMDAESWRQLQWRVREQAQQLHRLNEAQR